jgi:N-methylhydantoinase B
VTVDAVSLEVFRNLLASVAEEMGVSLCRTAYSVNIKERRDYSCAAFGPGGDMVAQAAHIPVHLGAMTASVRAGLDHLDLGPGDVAILNDPYLGGTHLPDVSLMAPVYDGGTLVGYVANRGHHADIGGMSPGSLPLSTELYQEGVIIPPLKLINAGVLNEELLELICRNTRTPQERRGDFAAQLAAIRTGEARLLALVERYGLESVHEHMGALLDYAESLTRDALRALPDGRYRFSDTMEGDGVTQDPLIIVCEAMIDDGHVTFDLTGTSPQTAGCINTPFAVTLSAALYVVRAILGTDVPANDGVRRAVTVVAPEGCLVNAQAPHAVSGGNVETSQRITDVMLGALAQAAPGRVPAASQGTMNNVLVGGTGAGDAYVYYETIAGGLGAGPHGPGASAIHSHMTNTLNTPIEALEFAFPLRVKRYAIRRGTGGRGRYDGGDGVVREMEFLTPAHVTLITERRETAPYGLEGGGPGQPGRNVLIRDGVEIGLDAKAAFSVQPGDLLRIETPGGGAWGAASE